MSANEKMVMVPRQWAQQTVSAGPGEYLSRSDIDLLSEALNQAAQQGQGESVGWQFYQQGRWWNGDDRIKDHRKNTEEAGIRTRDVFARPVLGQGEPVALPGRKPVTAGLLSESNTHNRGWNAYRDAMEKLGPLYTHADPAEVERLRADLESVQADRDAYGQNAIDLRAQLAEARALLARILGKRDPCPARYWFEEIEKVLSASAEPSVPVEIDEQPEFIKTITAKLQRFLDCAEDGQGADIGREWFDILTKLGLLRRIQRSPAWWEVTEQGDALLARAALARKP